MNEELHIEDGSGDRKYFTIIPNYVLNHSSHWDREVYIQMKRIAGENGKCWTARTTLAKQCGMSVKQLDRCLKYLLEHEWIRRIGTRKVANPNSRGGAQIVYEYQIIDLWKRNIDFYEKGRDYQSPPLGKGRDYQSPQGSDCGAHKEEPNTKEEHTSEAPLRTVNENDEEIPKPRSRAKYPHSKEVFGLWGKYPRLWERNTAILQAAEDIYSEIGMEDAKYAIQEFYPKNKNKPFCPQFSDPHEFLLKYKKLEAFSYKV